MGKTEFRQKEFRHLNFDHVQIVVEFGQLSKFYYSFDNVVEFLLLPKFLWNYDNIFFAGYFIVQFSSEFWQPHTCNTWNFNSSIQLFKFSTVRHEIRVLEKPNQKASREVRVPENLTSGHRTRWGCLRTGIFEYLNTWMNSWIFKFNFQVWHY
jgi:hypothetical protein